MTTILFNTFTLDGIVLWLGICATLALMCMIGAAHQRAKRLDWVLAAAIMVIQLVACLLCLMSEVFGLMDSFAENSGIAFEQTFADLVSMLFIVPIEITILLAARKFALARFKEKMSMPAAVMCAGVFIAEVLHSLKEELASIRRLDFYEHVDTEDEE